MRDSERYTSQAETVMRLAAKAESEAEKAVYLSIAEGWRKLAAEASRNERQDAGLGRGAPEPRTLDPET